MEKLAGDEGSTIELDRVLLVAQDEQVTVGRPTVDGARVTAEVQEQGRGEKIIVFKYKPKVRYSRKQGHRQSLTRLAIKEILTAADAPKRAPRRAAATAAAGAATKPARSPRPRRKTSGA